MHTVLPPASDLRAALEAAAAQRAQQLQQARSTLADLQSTVAAHNATLQQRRAQAAKLEDEARSLRAAVKAQLTALPEAAETMASGAPGSLAAALQRVQDDWNKAQGTLSKLLAVQGIGTHNKSKLLETHSCPTCRRGCRDDELQAVLDLIVRALAALGVAVVVLLLLVSCVHPACLFVFDGVYDCESYLLVDAALAPLLLYSQLSADHAPPRHPAIVLPTPVLHCTPMQHHRSSKLRRFPRKWKQPGHASPRWMRPLPASGLWGWTTGAQHSWKQRGCQQPPVLQRTRQQRWSRHSGHWCDEGCLWMAMSGVCGWIVQLPQHAQRATPNALVSCLGPRGSYSGSCRGAAPTGSDAAAGRWLCGARAC